MIHVHVLAHVNCKGRRPTVESLCGCLPSLLQSVLVKAAWTAWVRIPTTYLGT
jgi:hypothetical protein